MHPWMTEQLNRQHIEDLRSLGRRFGVAFRWRRLRRQGVARLKARSAADRETNAVELGARGTTGEPSLWACSTICSRAPDQPARWPGAAAPP
jgi:hypothetical protein